MVLEEILGLDVKKPYRLFFAGLIYATVGLFLSNSLFPHNPSWLMVAIMTIPGIYLFTNTLKKKTIEQETATSFKDLFNANSDVIEMYMFLFLGMMFALTIWFSVLPQQTADNIFTEQIYNLNLIRGRVSASAIDVQTFQIIAANNIQLVFLCAILSFIFGSGALLIMAWNASIVATAMGLLIRRINQAGADLVTSLLTGLPLSTSYYILHLIPEVMAYFLAGVAGAMISTAMMRYEPFTEKSKKLMLIAGGLIGIAIVFIVLGALIEIHISYIIQSQIRA
jgi:uncharacterized membrane protein SpoIIM required for sporulation